MTWGWVDVPLGALAAGEDGWALAGRGVTRHAARMASPVIARLGILLVMQRVDTLKGQTSSD